MRPLNGKPVCVGRNGGEYSFIGELGYGFGIFKTLINNYKLFLLLVNFCS